MGAALQQSLEPGAPPPTSEPRGLALEFRGTASEYFRIWAVNVCLTLITLGVFSAWAKVRKKRYLYASTRLDGTPLQYLGRPIPILKGRLVAAVLFAAYYVCSRVAPAKTGWLFLAMGVAAPWIVARGSSFNARFSAYRNITFRFGAGYWATFKALYAVPSLVIGAAAFSMFAPDQIEQRLGLIGTALALAGILYPWWTAGIKRFLVTRTSFGGIQGRLGAATMSFYWIYLAAAGMFVVILLLGSATVGLLAYLRPGSLPFTAVMMVVGYTVYGLFFAYVQARTTNLVWRTTCLGPIRFWAGLRARDLLWIYLSNITLAVLSMGLLVPWAVIRVLKYRISHMRVWVDGELGAFVGEPNATVSATGAEIGDLFDMEVSL